MTERQRAANEEAFVLHRRAFRDTSQIVEIFSRDYGRLSLVARGVRAARSRLRGTLQPFAPLAMSWSIRGDLGNLYTAEPAGPAHPLDGDSLLAGFYVNELILTLTHRHDPHPEIYALYRSVLTGLGDGTALEPLLRRFELCLLERLGYGMDFLRSDPDGSEVRDDERYRVDPASGVSRAERGESGRLVFAGAELRRIARLELDDRSTCLAARRITRAAIDQCLDGRELKTRRVMLQISERRGTS